jgi:hypothetical protein
MGVPNATARLLYLLDRRKKTRDSRYRTCIATAIRREVGVRGSFAASGKLTERGRFSQLC